MGQWAAAITLIAAVLWATADASPVEKLAAKQGVFLVEPATEIADFELTDQHGGAFHFSELRGRAALVFFGFTHCPDICPTTLQKLKLVHAWNDGTLSRVAVILISVDGDRDTPAAMLEFLQPFSSEFLGLTGDPRRVRDIAAQFAAVFFKHLPQDSAGHYLVQHTALVYLVDEGGRLRATFNDASVDTIANTTLAISPD